MITATLASQLRLGSCPPPAPRPEAGRPRPAGAPRSDPEGSAPRRGGRPAWLDQRRGGCSPGRVPGRRADSARAADRGQAAGRPYRSDAVDEDVDPGTPDRYLIAHAAHDEVARSGGATVVAP